MSCSDNTVLVPSIILIVQSQCITTSIAVLLCLLNCCVSTGETALSVAKTSNLKRLIKEAWTDQSNSSQLSLDLTSDSNHSIEHQDTGSHNPASCDVVQDGSCDINQSANNAVTASPNKKSCFITQVGMVNLQSIAQVTSCNS